MTRKVRRKKHKSISRIDSERSHGWYVRVQYKKKQYAKFFSDGAEARRNNPRKAKEASLECALAYRNRLEKALGKPQTDRVVQAAIHEPGIVIGRRGALPTIYVSWPTEIPGKNGRAAVAVSSRGIAAAVAIAKKLRKAKMEAFYIRETRND